MEERVGDGPKPNPRGSEQPGGREQKGETLSQSNGEACRSWWSIPKHDCLNALFSLKYNTLFFAGNHSLNQTMLIVFAITAGEGEIKLNIFVLGD